MNILKIKLIHTVTFISLLTLFNNYEMKAQLTSSGATIKLQSHRIFQNINNVDNLVGVRVFSKSNDECSLELFGGTTNTNWDHRFGKIKGSYNDHNKKMFSIEHSNSTEILRSIENNYTQLSAGAAKITQLPDGRVSIGSTHTIGVNLFKDVNDDQITNYTLFLEKGLLCQKAKIALKTTSEWSDYVFEEDYERMPLNELEDFVTENKHLPKVPSAEEMVANGLDVAKMDAKLLEKIEEAYLYIIDMNKEMKAMNEKVDALADENGALKASLSAISTSGK